MTRFSLVLLQIEEEGGLSSWSAQLLPHKLPLPRRAFGDAPSGLYPPCSQGQPLKGRGSSKEGCGSPNPAPRGRLEGRCLAQGRGPAQAEVGSFIRPTEAVGKAGTAGARGHSSSPTAHLFFPKGISRANKRHYLSAQTLPPLKCSRGGRGAHQPRRKTNRAREQVQSTGGTCGIYFQPLTHPW